MPTMNVWNKYLDTKNIIMVDTPSDYIYNVPEFVKFDIECVDNKRGQFSLTIGNTYRITKIRYLDYGIYRVKFFNDVSEECWYGLDLFTIPKEIQDKLATDICGDCGKKFDLNLGGDIIRDKQTGVEERRVCRECRSKYKNCGECYHVFKEDELEDYGMIKDTSISSRICKRCLENKMKNGKFVRCGCCNRFTYKTFNDITYYERLNEKCLCSRCRSPYRIVTQKIFNKNFFNFVDHSNDEDRECHCDEEDEECHCFDEDEDDGVYNNNINPLNSKTTDKFRTLGVELEVIPKKELGLLKACQLLKGEFHNRKFENVRYDDLVVVKEDGSLSRGGIEFNTTIFDTSPKKLKLLKEMVDIIDKYFEADKSCGLHIHLGARDLKDEQIKNIYWLYTKLESSIHTFVKSNRIRNRYCLPIEKFNKETFEKLSASDFFEEERYRAFNFAAYRKYGTIEVRLMEGTTNSEKILEWIELHNRIFKYAIKHSPKVKMISKKTEKVVKSVFGKKLYQSYNNRNKYKKFMSKRKGGE